MKIRKVIPKTFLLFTSLLVMAVPFFVTFNNGKNNHEVVNNNLVEGNSTKSLVPILTVDEIEAQSKTASFQFKIENWDDWNNPDYPTNEPFVTYSLELASDGSIVNGIENIVHENPSADGTYNNNVINLTNLEASTNYVLEVVLDHPANSSDPEIIVRTPFVTGDRATFDPSTVNISFSGNQYVDGNQVDINYKILKNGESAIDDFDIDYKLRLKGAEEPSNWFDVANREEISNSATEREERFKINGLIPLTDYEIKLRIGYNDDTSTPDNSTIIDWKEFRTKFAPPKLHNLTFLNSSKDNFKIRFDIDDYGDDSAVSYEHIEKIEYKAINLSDNVDPTCGGNLNDPTCGVVGDVAIITDGENEIYNEGNVGQVGGLEDSEITSNNSYRVYFKVIYDKNEIPDGETWDDSVWNLALPSLNGDTLVNDIEFSTVSTDHQVNATEDSLDFNLKVLDDGGINGYKFRYQFWEVDESKLSDPDYDPFDEAEKPHNLKWLVEDDSQIKSYSSNPDGQDRNSINFKLENLRPNRTYALIISARGYDINDSGDFVVENPTNSNEVNVLGKTLEDPSPPAYTKPSAKVNSTYSDSTNKLDFSLQINDPSNVVDLKNSQILLVDSVDPNNPIDTWEIPSLNYQFEYTFPNNSRNISGKYFVFKIDYLNEQSQNSILDIGSINSEDSVVPLVFDESIFNRRPDWWLPTVISTSIIGGLILAGTIWFTVYYVRIGRFKKKFRTRKPGALSFI